MLLVLVTLPCCLARRGRGGQHYRQSGERQGGSCQNREIPGEQVGEGLKQGEELESGRQSLNNSRKTYISIFRDFKQNRTEDDKKEFKEVNNAIVSTL